MYTPTDRERNQYQHIWVVAEQRRGEIKSVTFELLGAARELAGQRPGAEVWCVLMGENIAHLAPACRERQADVVVTVDAPALADFVDATYAEVLVRLIEKYKPETVLCGATACGRALIPRVAVQVYTGLTADCTRLSIDADTGGLLQTRPAFGGNIMATIKCLNHRPQMATVRPRVMAEPAPLPDRPGRIINEPFEPAWQRPGVKLLHTIMPEGEAMSLADARFIIAGGRGVKGQEGFDLLKRFAAMAGGAVGASRAAVDAGWIDYAHQVGQTGQTVQPRVYIACGVSGQIQHLVGMQSADVIIAINKDPEAPIMQIADYAMVGDLFEILPAMMNELRQV